MARQFGIISTVSGFTGVVVTSFDKQTTVEVAEARDGSGKVTDQKAYSRTTTLTATCLLDSADYSVAAGDSITFDSVSYLITNVTVREQNTEFATVTITAERKDSATIAAYS